MVTSLTLWPPSFVHRYNRLRREAGELINFGADAINNSTTIFDMLQFVFPAVS